MQLSTDKMIARKDSGIGWVIFNNPQKRNAISHEMRVALLDIFDAYDADDDVRVIVLKGAGDKAFVSGADISQFDEGDREIKEAVSRKAWGRYGQSPKPVIAMIHGYCLGGGLLIALNADLRIAADDAQFGVPAAKLGIAYPYDGVRKLVDSVGPIKITFSKLSNLFRMTQSGTLSRLCFPGRNSSGWARITNSVSG